MKRIFEWALGDAAAGVEPGFGRIAGHVDVLVPIWGHRMVGDLTETNRDAYLEARERRLVDR